MQETSVIPQNYSEDKCERTMQSAKHYQGKQIGKTTFLPNFDNHS